MRPPDWKLLEGTVVAVGADPMARCDCGHTAGEHQLGVGICQAQNCTCYGFDEAEDD